MKNQGWAISNSYSEHTIHSPMEKTHFSGKEFAVCVEFGRAMNLRLKGPRLVSFTGRFKI